ncbi:class I SAM-dependent methyltransferase [Micromonospora thermarum]|uniref:Class I SAM-dependent methyltransferase n=1 Tax=Micromonospora thermarum TaxID=2720024 RepID=A0ABX0Z176_9ACTN|nr:class I SAM-dependent methyltransferase [Micromonospora thermarum]NJP30892.1 class I SAM-dependent methyltransferase [Micromonospora thermarum]
MTDPCSASIRNSYDVVADRYAAEVGDELRGKPLDRGLLDALAETTAGGVVVDVGCGPGHVAAYLADRGAECAGLDLSPAMCALARRDTGLPYAVADMTALPLRSASVDGLVSLYAVIHLDRSGRAAAYAEFARVLRPGGAALVAFHTSDADIPAGGSRTLTDWWGERVALTFHFLDAAAEVAALAAAGLHLTARLDRAPHPGVEHASQRSYLLVRRS